MRFHVQADESSNGTFSADWTMSHMIVTDTYKYIFYPILMKIHTNIL